MLGETGGPQTTKFSRRSHPFQRAQRRLGRYWDGGGFGSHASKVLPVGNAAAARRVASEERSRPATSSVSSTFSTSVGSQRCALAVASTSGAVRRMCGSRIRRSNASSSGSSGGGVGVLVVMIATTRRR